jgi:hypothetical protein
MVDDQGLGKLVNKFDLPKKYLIVDVVLEKQWSILLQFGDQWYKFIYRPEGRFDGSTVGISFNFEINGADWRMVIIIKQSIFYKLLRFSKVINLQSDFEALNNIFRSSSLFSSLNKRTQRKISNELF